MSSAKWHYKWSEISIRLQAYIRYQLEETLDGFEKPYIEVLAYVYDEGEQGSWYWRAFKHEGDEVKDMKLANTQLMHLQVMVENSFSEQS